VSEFNNQKNVRLGELATEGLVIYFTGFMFAGINILAAAYFSVVGNAKFGITIAVLRSCVIMVPMVIILSNFFGMTGLWLSFLITEFLVCLLIVIVSKRRQKYSALPNL
jgi:Na+-driven multidrug efflux pump